MRRLVLILGCLLVASPAMAQAPCSASGTTYTCQAGSPHTASWDYAGLVAGDVFKLLVDGAQVGPDIPATNGTVQVQFGAMLPAKATGYVVVVQAVRGASAASSAPITLVLTPAPISPPTNLKIVEVIMRGLDVAGNELWRHVTQMSVTAGQ